MNRSQLVEEIASSTGLVRKQAAEAVDAFAGTVSSQVRAGNKVTIYGFGSFSPTAHKARTGRNPRTGAPVKIAASKGIRFSPAAGLKEELNSKKSAAKKSAPARAAAKTPARATKAAPAKAAKSAKSVKAAPSKATGKRAAVAVKKVAPARTVKSAPKRAVAAKAAPSRATAKKAVPAKKSAATKATRSAAKATKRPAKRR